MHNNEPYSNSKPIVDILLVTMTLFMCLAAAAAVAGVLAHEKEQNALLDMTSPKGSDGERQKPEDLEVALNVFIDSDGSLTCNGKVVSIEELKAELSLLDPNSYINVSGDRSFDECIPIMVVIQQSGMNITAGDR